MASNTALTRASAASTSTIIAPTPLGSSLPMFRAARSAGRIGLSARGIASFAMDSARSRTCLRGTLWSAAKAAASARVCSLASFSRAAAGAMMFATSANTPVGLTFAAGAHAASRPGPGRCTRP